MTAPAAPYCETDSVAHLLPQLVRSQNDFSESTQPVKAVVTKFINWIAAEIDMTFAVVGFYVPYQEISGETWPTLQTNMLELMNAFGAAGMIVGPVVKPAPSMGRDSGTTDNAFTASYKAFLDSIRETGAGFRMNYRVGSRAEQICRTPRGPLTDYLNGYLDPTLFQTTVEYTNTIEQLRADYGIASSTTWDHLRTKRESLLA